MTSPRSARRPRFFLRGVLPYERAWLSSDLLAGVSAGAVVIPQAMGYATVAGLPVEIGLYTCIFPLAVYALLGGAHRLSFSTTSTIVALTGLALTTVGATDPGEAVTTVATLTAMVGVTLILFRVIRLGWMVEAVSEAVIDGLKIGVGLTIIADQLPKLLGIDGTDGGFFADVGNALDQFGSFNAATVTLATVTIAGMLALRKWLPRVPGPLLAVAGGIALVAFSDVTSRGLQVIPDVPTGLPALALPGLAHAVDLIPFALAIGFMSYFESITAARISRQTDEPRLDNDHEYVAVGAATLAGALFQTVPPAGGFSQTQVNVNAGARTQVSEIVTAALAILVALFLAPILSDLPEATLGAVVTVSVLGLVSLGALNRLAQIDRLELVIAVLTALAALVFDLLIGVLVGVLLTMYFVLRAVNHPVVNELRRPEESPDFLVARPEDPLIDAMLILRIEGGMYTMNIRRIQDEVYDRFASADPKPDVVLVDVGATVDTSVTVIDAWLEIDQHLSNAGATLWLAAIPARALVKVQRAGLYADWVRMGKVHDTVRAAVESFESRADQSG